MVEALPLRWGNYTDRYLGGLALIISSAVLLLATNTYTLPFLAIGTVAHVTGWLILPARGSRRLWAFWPSLLSCYVLLVGPQVLWILAVPLVGWLLVRERPLRCYLVLLFPIATGVILSYLFTDIHAEPLAFGIASFVVVGAAWLAAALAKTP